MDVLHGCSFWFHLLFESKRHLLHFLDRALFSCSLKNVPTDSAVLFSVVSENCLRAGHTRLEATSGVPQSKGVAKRNHQIYASSIVAYAVHTSIKYKTSKADGTTWRRRTLTSCLHLRPRKCARCRPLATASHNSFLPFSARIPKVADMIKWDKSYRLLST